MRLAVILLAVVLALADCSELWAEFGDWAVPYTWLIWFCPMPIVWDSPNTCEVSRFFHRIMENKQ